jgi:hypothetical protein
MPLTPFQRAWMELARRFNLRVQAPFRVQVGTKEIEVPVLLEQFGAAKGMLLLPRYAPIAAVADQLVGLGFGYSCLGDWLGEPADTEAIADMLRDWGWTGEGNAPDWYTARN